MQDRDLRRFDCINARLLELVKVKTEKIENIRFIRCDYEKPYAFPEKTEPFHGVWGGEKDSHYWFGFSIDTPLVRANERVNLVVNTGLDGWDVDNPQFILYVNGEIKHGLDIHHKEVELESNTHYEIWLYGYTATIGHALTLTAEISVLDERIYRLQRYISACGWLLSCTENQTKERSELVSALENTVNLLDLRVPYSEEFFTSVDRAYAYISEAVKTDEKRPTVWCVGSTHIDFAWLWTKSQTKEKVLRSVSTAINLMERNPQYKFHLSQPAEYKYVKEQSPALYAKIKEFVKKGQWDAEGGMWVEADCNLSSGESLVRQILVGKKFFKEEFGVDSKVLWLPDVFGYSAALPQILKKCGIDLFVTSKISWNEFNRMPHEIFDWKGIDGTEIFTYFITTQEKRKGGLDYDYCTYVGHGTPSEVQGTYYRLSDKHLSDSVLMPYGWGDGGGGSTQEMIDWLSTMQEGMFHSCRTRFSTVSEFREEIKRQTEGKQRPKWVGELYLEFHRGTYTSMASVKKNNRRAEFALWNSEWYSVLAERLCAKSYPKERIDGALETILENQFHDILPGSSIEQVYKDTDEEYGRVFNVLDSIKADAVQAIADKTKGKGLVVFNPNGFKADGIVTVDGKSVFVRDIPAKGYKLVECYGTENNIFADGNVLENTFFKITFDQDGFIYSLFDKCAKREAVASGGRMNVLTAYEDMPYEFDNWEIKEYYEQKSWEIKDVVSRDVVDDGARKGLKITRKFLSSRVTQTVWLYEQLDRIDFDTEIDWREEHILLKAIFDVGVNASCATYDIQYGAVVRPTHKNTSWDEARFETCAHKFVDVAEYGYGVSLLNDCKYGHGINENRVGITLLKSGTYPNPNADKGRHVFTYSLYPHMGDYRQVRTIEYAYLLNNPLFAVEVDNLSGELAREYSFVSTNKKNVLAEVVKQAEDKNGVVVRLYENANAATQTTLCFGEEIVAAYECDLLENREKTLETDGRSVNVRFNPYEIKTLYLKLGNKGEKR